MKKILRLAYYALISILIFLPQMAFAAAGSISPFSIRLFTPPSTDYSLIFLRKIFGITFLSNVGAAIEHIPEVIEAHQTIIGTLFGIFNAGVISIAAIFLIYTTVRSIVDTAQEGEIMGKKISHWAAIRAAFGIGILVPKFSGYSFIQIFVLWTIVQGVGLADHAWNMALDFLQKGGVIYETSAAIKTNPNKIDVGIVNADQSGDPISDKASSSDVFNSMICMHILDRYYQGVRKDKLRQFKNNPHDNAKPGTAAYRQRLSELSTSYRFHTQHVYIGGDDIALTVPGFRNNEKLPDYMPPKSQLTNKCGGYMWLYGGGGTTNSYQNARKDGIVSMITSLNSPAKRMVDYVLNNPKSKIPSAYITSAAQQIVSAALSYQTIIYPERLLEGRSKQKRAKRFYGGAKKAGWSMAGSYYHDISTVTQIGQLDDKYYKPLTYLVPAPNTDNTKGARYATYIGLLKLINDSQEIKSAATKVLTFGDSAGITAYNAAKKINAEIDKEDVGIVNLPDLASSSMFNPDDESAQQVFQVGFSNPMMNDVANLISFVGSALPMPGVIYQDLAVAVNNSTESWFRYMASPVYRDFSPIAKLYNFGSDLISNATQFWTKVSINMIASGTTFLAAQMLVNGAQTVIATLTGTSFGVGAGAISGMNTFVQILDHIHAFFDTISFSALPLALAVTGPMITMGVIFSVYIPLIPFILFLFGVISWLIFVIEAIAAAPLVALGITHPEGHDLLGKSEQAIMLLLAVFLRPICMIIGLIVSIVLSYVALEVLNAGFAHVIQSTGIVSTDWTHIDAASSIKNIGVLVAYTFIVVALINQSFSPIYKLIEAMMEWIGFHIRPSGDEQLAEIVKGGVQQFGEAAGKGMGESAASLKPAGSLGSLSGSGEGESGEPTDEGQATEQGGDGGGAEGAGSATASSGAEGAAAVAPA